MLETLRCLDAKLRQKGSKLFVCVGSPDKVIPALVGHNSADLLTFERQTEPHNVARDKRVKEALEKMSVKVEYIYSILYTRDSVSRYLKNTLQTPM